VEAGIVSAPLSQSQARAISAVAEVGSGVSIRAGTARALERRGLIEVSGEAFGARGVTVRLTREGKREALTIFREQAARADITSSHRESFGRIRDRLQRELDAGLDSCQARR
jgi:DNA-binding MarR family transcriptional regulator